MPALGQPRSLGTKSRKVVTILSVGALKAVCRVLKREEGRRKCELRCSGRYRARVMMISRNIPLGLRISRVRLFSILFFILLLSSSPSV